MSLKDYTKDLHTEVEKTEFSKLLLSGKITTEQYATYLYQMLLVYNPIELGVKLLGVLDDLPGIERTNLIYQDFIELAGKDYSNKWVQSAIDYNRYLVGLIGDKDRRHLIKAHFYVRHMGDLFGGQFIAKMVPGSGRMYKFKDIETLKSSIRSIATDDLGDEARVAFKWAIAIMNDLNVQPN